MPKRRKPRTKSFKAFFRGKTISSEDKEALSLYNKSRFGEPINKKITYSIVEALYLINKGKLSVYEQGKKAKKKISFDKILDKVRKTDKNIWSKFCVYRDMRNRGYILKTALKFGADFRVYEKGVKPGQKHAKWILFPVHETSKLTWHEFAAKNRVAHSTKKNLLIAIVDEEGDIIYYEVKWLRP
jgi:tRNA-intron endonuclease